MPRLRITAIALTGVVACIFVAGAYADTCAGHRASYLGYGGGMPRRAATPFAGTMNPRYANSAHAGGPALVFGPTDYLARQSAYVSPTTADPTQPESQPVEYASDIELMDGPVVEEPEQQPAISPDYPGQFAAAEAQAPPIRHPAPRMASRVRPQRVVGQGAFSAPASQELARAMSHAF